MTPDSTTSAAEQIELDLRGYKCPIPVLKARKAFAALDGAFQAQVLVTDPKAPKDFGDFCELAGYQLAQVEVIDGGHRLIIHSSKES